MYAEMEREKVIEYLKEIMYDGKSIIIIDPYFFSKSANITLKNYINDMEKVLENINEILIITHWNKENYEKEVKEFFQKKNIKYRIFKTRKLHDRLWIKNKVDYYVVGSSFNSVSFSFGFIYQLERHEIKVAINKYLIEKINLSHLHKKIKQELEEFLAK